MSRRKPRFFQPPDGPAWRVEVGMPGTSNAIVYFRHRDGSTGARDRYAWYITHGPEAKSVTARLDPARVLATLGDDDLALLFRRSMPIARANGPVD